MRLAAKITGSVGLSTGSSHIHDFLTTDLAKQFKLNLPAIRGNFLGSAFQHFKTLYLIQQSSRKFLKEFWTILSTLEFSFGFRIIH